MILGQVLHKYRVVTELSVRDLAKVVGIPYATLNRLERGENIDAKTFYRILAWLVSE